MAPIELNGQKIDQIALNGNTIDEVTANGQTVFSAGPAVFFDADRDSGLNFNIQNIPTSEFGFSSTDPSGSDGDGSGVRLENSPFTSQNFHMYNISGTDPPTNAGVVHTQNNLSNYPQPGTRIQVFEAHDGCSPHHQTCFKYNNSNDQLIMGISRTCSPDDARIWVWDGNSYNISSTVPSGFSSSRPDYTLGEFFELEWEWRSNGDLFARYHNLDQNTGVRTESSNLAFITTITSATTSASANALGFGHDSGGTDAACSRILVSDL